MEDYIKTSRISGTSELWNRSLISRQVLLDN